MSHQHNHPQHNAPQDPKGPWWKQVHRDWRVWLGVILMTIAMVIYVLTLNLSTPPVGKPQPKMPAAL